MNKKISLGAAIAFMIVIAGITFSITMMVSVKYFNTKVFDVKILEEKYKKIADIDGEIRQNFYGTINEEKLLDYVSRGYIRGIDDTYSSYLSKSEYEQRLKELSGTQVGIGIDFKKDETGYIKIQNVLEESPAHNAGLMVGDYIVSINETDLKLVTTEKISSSLLGEVGTKLKLVYRRDGVETPLNEIIRTDIKIPVVEMEMIDTNAYIKIMKFDDSTFSQFKEHVNSAISQGATGLIFDVRNNDGGVSLEPAIEMLDMLLPPGTLATQIDKDDVETVIATSDKYEIALPMVTIVNSKTASSSELFVAALRDFKKASSVGTSTFGKGVVQTLIQLTDGSAINLTTAHFYPPSGDDINEVGIKPDYEVKLTQEQEANFELLTPDLDPQILKAIEVINSTKSE